MPERTPQIPTRSGEVSLVGRALMAALAASAAAGCAWGQAQVKETSCGGSTLGGSDEPLIAGGGNQPGKIDAARISHLRRELGRIDDGSGGPALGGDDSESVSQSEHVDLRCRADIDGDGEVTAQDLFAFFNAFDRGDLAADVSRDGRLDLGDLFVFLEVFDDGCR